jgi:hypothetical protein
MNNLTRDELKQKLKLKIQSKSNNRKYAVNRKKGEELQQKLNDVKKILDENSINSINDLNNDNIFIKEKINNILSNDDLKYLLTKISDNNNLIELLKQIKNN